MRLTHYLSWQFISLAFAVLGAVTFNSLQKVKTLSPYLPVPLRVACILMSGPRKFRFAMVVVVVVDGDHFLYMPGSPALRIQSYIRVSPWTLGHCCLQRLAFRLHETPILKMNSVVISGASQTATSTQRSLSYALLSTGAFPGRSLVGKLNLLDNADCVHSAGVDAGTDLVQVCVCSG